MKSSRQYSDTQDKFLYVWQPWLDPFPSMCPPVRFLIQRISIVFSCFCHEFPGRGWPPLPPPCFFFLSQPLSGLSFLLHFFIIHFAQYCPSPTRWTNFLPLRFSGALHFVCSRSHYPLTAFAVEYSIAGLLWSPLRFVAFTHTIVCYNGTQAPFTRAGLCLTPVCSARDLFAERADTDTPHYALQAVRCKWTGCPFTPDCLPI